MDSLVGSKSTEQEQASTPVATADREGILVTDEGGVRTITLNRPNKKNAITTKVCIAGLQMYKELVHEDEVLWYIAVVRNEYQCISMFTFVVMSIFLM